MFAVIDETTGRRVATMIDARNVPEWAKTRPAGSVLAVVDEAGAVVLGRYETGTGAPADGTRFCDWCWSDREADGAWATVPCGEMEDGGLHYCPACVAEMNRMARAGTALGQ